MAKKRLNNDIRKRDKAIDAWVDKAIEASPYTRDLIFKGLRHIIAKQNEDIKKSIELSHRKRER